MYGSDGFATGGILGAEDCEAGIVSLHAWAGAFIRVGLHASTRALVVFISRVAVWVLVQISKTQEQKNLSHIACLLLSMHAAQCVADLFLPDDWAAAAAHTGGSCCRTAFFLVTASLLRLPCDMCQFTHRVCPSIPACRSPRKQENLWLVPVVTTISTIIISSVPSVGFCVALAHFPFPGVPLVPVHRGFILFT